MAIHHYTQIADLYRYPSVESALHIEQCLDIVATNYPLATDMFLPMQKHINTKTLTELQEYYIKTFDVQAVCFLDIGYVLFGEDYKRGDFLVLIKKEQEKVQNNCGVELADHLPNLLTLLPKMKDTELREELVISLFVPALEEMIIQFKEINNVYCELLRGLVMLLQTDFVSAKYTVYKVNSENDDPFLKPYSCGIDNSLIEKKQPKNVLL